MYFSQLHNVRNECGAYSMAATNQGVASVRRIVYYNLKHTSNVPHKLFSIGTIFFTPMSLFKQVLVIGSILHRENFVVSFM